jgi:hypothetical protein
VILILLVWLVVTTVIVAACQAAAGVERPAVGDQSDDPFRELRSRAAPPHGARIASRQARCQGARRSHARAVRPLGPTR